MADYFATLQENDVLAELNRRVSRYDEWLSSSGVMSRWARVLKVYNGLKPDDGDQTISTVRLRSGGKQGELAYLHANHFRNLCQHVLVLVTGQRPALQVRASNSDSASQVQAQLGNSVIDYYLREKKVEANLKQAVEHCVLWGESHITTLWNPGAGDPYVTDPETQRVVREGDIEVRNVLPNDVIRDVNARRLADSPWRIIRRVENKYELAARFPDKAQAIMGTNNQSITSKIAAYNEYNADSDLIPVYWFFHDKSDLLPDGRMTYFVDGAVLVDGSLAYDGIPVYSLIPSEIPNLPTGYTPSFDALPLQESINIIGSSIISNQRAFGVQNIWTKPGGVSVNQVAGSLNLIESNERPEALQLCATPPELFNFRQTLIQEMENIMGVNSVVRGNPEANLKSGAALALVASQAVQFMSGLQGAYNSAMESVGGAMLRLLQTYAKTTRVATIVGLKGRAYQKQFSGADLAAARSVVVEQVAAVSKTAAGQIEIANQLLQAQMIKRPEEYLSVVTTGKLDPLVEDDSAKLLLVRAENEALLEGRPHLPHVGEIHADHIQGHLNLLASPEAKENPQLVIRVLEAVNEHIALWRSADPAILMITGQQPPPQPARPPAPPGAPPGPQGEVSPAVMNQAQPNQPNMPRLPEGAPAESQAAYEQLAPQATPGMVSG